MTRRTITLGLFAACLATAVGAQEPESKEERRRALLEGTHVFRRILHDHDFTALETFDALADRPARTLLVALGDLSVLDQVPGGLQGFVRRGGAVLAASDRAVSSARARDQLLAISGVSINQETLIAPDQSDSYQGLRYCPRIHGFEPRDPNLFRHSDSNIAAPLAVYTNVPSSLTFRQQVGRVRDLGYFPEGFLLELSPRVFRQFENALLFAVGGDVGAGRVLVLADHSVFINQMMLPHDTNNVEFTYNAVRWLQGEGLKRNRVLLVVDGEIQTKLDIPLKSITLPLEEMAKLLFAKRNELLVSTEEAVSKLEDEDAFNRKLFDALAEAGWDPVRVQRVGLLIASLIIIGFLAYRVGVRGRFRHDTTVPLLTATVAKHLPDEPLVQQRQRAMRSGGNLWEPASVLARRWFGKLGLDATAIESPAFAATGGWWQRRRLVGQLRRIWRLAAGRSPVRITQPELWRLQRELDELKAGWERGAWRIAS